MDDLVSSLRALAEKDINLGEVATVLERHANQKGKVACMCTEENSYKALVDKYHQSQIASKTLKSKAPTNPKTSKQYFSLNFAKYEQVLKGLKKKTTNVQVAGFCDSDTYMSVIEKAAKGLRVSPDSKYKLVCSGGIVYETDICGEEWTVGEYNGGVSNRSRKVWGLLVEEDDEDDPFSETAEGVHKSIGRCLTPDVAPPCKKHKVAEAVCTSKDNPVLVSSEGKFIELDPAKVIGKYSPVYGGNVCTSVIGIGLTGAWRLFDFQYRASTQDVTSAILQETNFQPEKQGYYLIEVQHGSETLCKVIGPPGQLIKADSVVFSVNVKRTTITMKHQVLKDDLKYATLLVLSPEHGRVMYEWDWRVDSKSSWESLVLPSRTCLLYVRDPGEYRCTFGESFEVVTFCVALSGVKRKQEDWLFVEIKDITFGPVIGRGAFGIVHKGKWSWRDVALKSIRLPQDTCILSSNLPQEVDILRKLNHPNIISLLGYSQSNEELVLITNYVDGSNLHKLLFGKNAIEMTDHQALLIATKVADAVHYLHTRNPIIIHQDLKPQNVLVSSDFHGVYVCDLGIAKVKMAAQTTMTCVSKGPGTYPFMAPEMFRKSHRGPAVDIYSLGCLFIELFGKKRVWQDLDAPDIMMCVLGSYNTPPQMPDVSHLHSPFKELCTQMCQLDPNNRPTSGAVVELLKVSK